MKKANLALITGASGGIGWELAHIHAARGGQVLAVARSQERLAALQAKLEAQHGCQVHVKAMDLALPHAASELTGYMKQLGLQPSVLINNAGVGGLGEFAGQSLHQIEQMLMLNVQTLTSLTRLLLPDMIANGRGKILHVASAASFMPGALHAVYYASKAYVFSLSEALRLELQGTGVSVTALCPGPTESDFLQRAGGPATHVFKAKTSAEVAKAGYEAMMEGKGLVIPGVGLAWMLKLLPRATLAKTTLLRNRRILLQMGTKEVS